MASATCTIELKSGHRKSSRPEEYVGYLVNQPDGDTPATSYTLDTDRPGDHQGEAVPSLVNGFSGLTETPPSTIPLSPATSADPIAEEEVTATQGQTTQTIYHSKRGCMVTRWATNLAAHGINQEWLYRGWHEGLGVSLNPNIRWKERLFTPSQSNHNPTTGGQALIPTENDDPNDLITSRLLYHENASGGAGTAFAASACNPLEWDSLGWEGQTPHGQSATRTALWWRHKMFQRVDPFHGGDEYVHRVTAWYFLPRAWHESEFGGDVYQGGSTARFTFGYDLPIGVWNIFDEAYYFDCESKTLTAINGWADVPDPGQGAWEAYDSLTRDLITGEETDSPFPSGYGAIILRRTLDDFTIALAAKVGGHPVTNGQMGRYTLPTYLHTSRTFHGIIPTTPDIGGKDTSMFGMTAGSFTGAQAGWHGLVGFLFVGVWSNVQDTLGALYDNGVLDEQPDTSLIPNVVADGTEFDNSSTLAGSALFTLTFDGSATADASSGGPGPVEVPDLVVEDGTGLSTAESYATVDYADSFALRHGNPASWVNATAANKQLYLRLATERDIDGVYGPFWSGYRATEEQALDWPRVDSGDRSTNQPIDDDVVPERVKKATAYMAMERAAGAAGSLVIEAPGEGGATQSTDRAAGGFEESRTYDGHRSTQYRYRYVESLLGPLLLDDDTVSRA